MYVLLTVLLTYISSNTGRRTVALSSLTLRNPTARISQHYIKIASGTLDVVTRPHHITKHAFFAWREFKVASYFYLNELLFYI
jgi:hypothetical protein